MRLLPILTLLSPLALAAEPTLPPILISGGRTAEPGIDIPTSAVVIDREDIEDSGAANVADLFRLHAEGKIRPFISNRYALERTADAITELAERRARGKVVVEI